MDEEYDRGDPAATYAAEYPRMVGLAAKLLREYGIGQHRLSAEDAVQTAWAATLARYGITDYKAYAYKAIRHCVLQEVRRKSAEPTADPAAYESADETSSSSDAVHEVMTRIDVERAMTRLSPMRRQVLLAAAVMGRSHREIGAEHGMSAGWATYQIAQARATLVGVLATLVALLVTFYVTFTSDREPDRYIRPAPTGPRLAPVWPDCGEMSVRPAASEATPSPEPVRMHVWGQPGRDCPDLRRSWVLCSDRPAGYSGLTVQVQAIRPDGTYGPEQTWAMFPDRCPTTGPPGVPPTGGTAPPSASPQASPSGSWRPLPA